ncbi:MAG TPA: hypothetical protein VFB49_09615 [Patescibacteria group bacterium]|nr:hypothetical protein [Patescibacteria group bacterium]
MSQMARSTIRSPWALAGAAFFAAGIVASWLATPTGIASAAAPSSVHAQQAPRPDAVDERRAVEAVYWSHRVWPTSNPGAKPSLNDVLPRSAISARVDDGYRKHGAVERYWNRSITGEMVQAEMDRMAAGTKSPDILRELFAALGNDPERVAEHLALPLLADRLLRDAYAGDRRFHEAARRSAEEGAAQIQSRDDMPRIAQATGGRYSEPTLVAEGVVGSRRGGEALDSESWDQAREEIARSLGVSAGTRAALLPLNRPGRLEEDAYGFHTTLVLKAEEGKLSLATITWPKRSFDDWWAEAALTTAPIRGLPRSTYTLPAIAAGACALRSWTDIHRSYPYPRSSAAAAWTGTELLVWGGDSQLGLLGTGARYNPATDTWTDIHNDSNTPTSRATQGTWTGTEMIVYGCPKAGATLSSPCFPDGSRYNPTTDSWTRMRIDPNGTASLDAPLVWTGTELIVWGSADGTQAPGVGSRYRPSTDSWTKMPAGPPGRIGHTAVWTGTEMIVWGGAWFDGNDVPHNLSDGARFNPSTGQWVGITRNDATTAEARGYSAAAWTGSEMMVWGGWQAAVEIHYNPYYVIKHRNYLNSGALYNPATDLWRPIALTGSPGGGICCDVFWTGSKVLLASGTIPSQYDPATDQWFVSHSGATAPAVGGWPAAVWTGTELILWSGLIRPGIYNDSWANAGGRYNPVTDSWIPIASDTTVPRARNHAATVWTGTEMIVWGGQVGPYGPEFLGTGGRYDPATDSWTGTSIDPATPSPRAGATAVWTGTEMVVWGGSAGLSEFPSTGGRYSPALDHWTPTSIMAGTATGRSLHTAVWTGTEMIVWGGEGPCCSGPVATGGRYRPSDDTWTPTRSDATAPSSRESHSAVWTGQEMIVWGGIASTATFNTGGRYDPATDAWTPTRVDATTPQARREHTAVWTGSRMVIWGGDTTYIVGGADQTGSLYDPGTDSWTPTAIDPGTPSPRYSHAAVWTGQEMIVWGGYFDGAQNRTPLNSGGEYDPALNAWLATPTTTGTPDARGSFSAVQTGDALLVWGGDGYLWFDTGGAYCTCQSPNVTFYPDADHDGHGVPGTPGQGCFAPYGFATTVDDCNDADPGAWSVPGETRNLRFMNATTIQWSAPAEPGGGVPVYDLLRSTVRSDFVNHAVCIDLGEFQGPPATDSASPPVGTAFYYLSRARNFCPTGQSPLGFASDGTPTAGITCP